MSTSVTRPGRRGRRWWRPRSGDITTLSRGSVRSQALISTPGSTVSSALSALTIWTSSRLSSGEPGLSSLDLNISHFSCGAKVGWEQILLSTNCRDEGLKMKIVQYLLEFYQPSIDDINITNNPEVNLTTQLYNFLIWNISSQLVETLRRAACTPYSLRKLSRISIRDNLGRAGRGRDIRPLVGKLEGLITRDAMDFIIDI